MNLITTALMIILHFLALLLMPPLLLGIVNRVKAIFAGRRGQSLLQVYFDLYKLMQKQSVLSTTTTWVFQLGPAASLVATLIAALFVPLGIPSTPVGFQGDLIFFAYVLALGRFCTMAAAMDTGSAFEGMGAVREATFACLAEPILFFGLLVLAHTTGELQLSAIFAKGVTEAWVEAAAPLLLIVASWFVVLLVENCRIPFDDPNTHLELTMIHEVMVLDHSGPAFGLITYGAAMKLFLFSSLIVNLAIPWRTGWTVFDWAIHLVAIVGIAVIVGVTESIMARLKMSEIPKLLVGASVVSLFAVILSLSH